MIELIFVLPAVPFMWAWSKVTGKPVDLAGMLWAFIFSCFVYIVGGIALGIWLMAHLRWV